MISSQSYVTDFDVRPLTGRVELSRAACLGLVIPLIAVILQVGVQSAQINAGERAEFVVSRPGITPAVAVVTVFADGIVVVNRVGERGRRVDRRLEVIYTASVEIV